jgi:hypothetical protein
MLRAIYRLLGLTRRQQTLCTGILEMPICAGFSFLPFCAWYPKPAAVLCLNFAAVLP